MRLCTVSIILYSTVPYHIVVYTVYIYYRSFHKTKIMAAYNYFPHKNRNSVQNKVLQCKKERIKQIIEPELIEPRKIYVSNLPRSVTKGMLQDKFVTIGSIEEICLLRNHRNGNAYPYAFIKFSNDEETERALNLTGRDLKMNGYRLHIKAAKMLIKMPGFPNYVRKPIDDNDYDLEPVVFDQPSAHALNDYVLLKIFDCIPFRKLVPFERVCRRWQSLVYSSFKRRVSKYIKNDIASWMTSNKIGRNIREFTKVLIFGGESIEELRIVSEVIIGGDIQLFRIIGQLCPNLMSITFTSNIRLKAIYFTELGNLCPKLEQFIIGNSKDKQIPVLSSISSSIFSTIVSALPKLRVLRLSDTIVDVDSLSNLPKHLMELQLFCFKDDKSITSMMKLYKALEGNVHDDLDFLELQMLEELGIEPRSTVDNFDVSGILRCSDLEILDLRRTRLTIPVFNNIGKFCKKLRVLKLSVDKGSESEILIDWDLFKNLESLSCHTSLLNVDKILTAFPKLEQLKLSSSFDKDQNTVYDFSQLQNLKQFELTDSCPHVLNTVSLQTFNKCKNLVEFKYCKTVENNRFLLALINNCPKLTTLECPFATIVGTDIMDFVNANRGRGFRLKFVVGLDHSALDQIEKLEEANYNIEMFDTDNLFGGDNFDMLYTSGDDDDDYEDYFDSDDMSIPSDYDGIEDFFADHEYNWNMGQMFGKLGFN